MSQDSGGEPFTVPSQEASVSSRVFAVPEAASRDELVTGSYSSTHRGLTQSTGVSAEGAEETAVLAVPATRMESQLKREIFAERKRVSTDSDTSDTSSDVPSTSSSQDTRSQPNAAPCRFKKKIFCYDLFHLKETSRCVASNIPVSIPSAVTKTRCENARLQLHITPYRKQTTPWPDRFSFLSATLRLPQKYKCALTVENTCRLVLEVSVTGDDTPLPDFTPVQLMADVPHDTCEVNKEVCFLSYPTVLDADCAYFNLLVQAWLVLTPRLMETEAEGFVCYTLNHSTTGE